MNAYAYELSNPLTYIDNNGQLVNFALQAVWWGLGQAGTADIRCFGQCLVASATEASIGVLWQYMMGDCEPGFEFSEMAVLAMQNCGYSCLNPRNWGGKRAKASTKSKAYESRAHGVGGGNEKVKGTRVTKKEGRNLPFTDKDRVTEINKTLDRIDNNGPFPHKRDGITFKNREGKLPDGNYKEYTVDTPGASNRGARQIVRDQDTENTYYTDDHYKNFMQVDVKKY